MKALLVKVGSAKAEQVETDGKLESLQKLVGGSIEYLPLPCGAHAYIDEEGKLKGKPMNSLATHLLCKEWNIGLGAGDFIVGDLVILGDDGKGDEADAPAELIEQTKALGFLA